MGMRNPIIAVPPSRNERICCSHCSVSVSAVNSVGQSPVKFINLHFPGKPVVFNVLAMLSQITGLIKKKLISMHMWSIQ